MSERGSFTTQFIYCDACENAARTFFARSDLPLDLRLLEGSAPIIAGMARAAVGYPGEEIEAFYCEYSGLGMLADLAPLLCHPMRVTVLADTGSAIFVVDPAGGVRCLASP